MKSHDVDTRYFSLAIILILCDRLTKWLALVSLQEPKQITSFLQFELAFNRGVSWGLFHSDEQITFFVITLVIATIIALLFGYTIIQRINHHVIYGEVAVLTGACSNFIDRCVYGGVIDFIHLSYGSYSWPIFNIADIAIVLGVFWIVWEHKSS
jgi:signal peptidase II